MIFLTQRFSCRLSNLSRTELSPWARNPVAPARLVHLSPDRKRPLVPRLEKVAPELKHLEIWDRDGRELGPLLRVLAMRVKGGLLKSLKLHLDSDPSFAPSRHVPEPYFQRLCALAESGLTVLVTARGGDDADDYTTLLNTAASPGSAWWLANRDL